MEKINIAELLENCPKGMELDCTMYDNLYFDGIDKDCAYPIGCYTIYDDIRTSVNFTEYGEFRKLRTAKCVIFPKGKTTWEGFVPPCKFKDGDIVATNSGKWLGIVKNKCDSEYHTVHCAVDYTFNATFHRCGEYCFSRLATEEEKQKLFKAIKDNGYEWYPESKTLKKFIESKEDTNDEIVMSGIYFDRENYADEVELHLGNYEIEVRDGKTYAVYKNQETKISKPIFKIGDKIKHKDTVLTIINVLTNSYVVEDEPDNFGLLMFSQQDKWELINGHIVIEMSGAYAALKIDIGYTWDSMGKYKYWKFK